MAYHITKITNNSSKTVVLTNPRTPRDRHLVTKNNSLLPGHPPLVECIRESDVPYETAVKKTLNIFTKNNNWCFWDNGSDTLVVLGEGAGSNTTIPTHAPTDLELTIDENGTPNFRWSKLSLPLKMQHQEYNNWCWAAVTVSVANFYSKKDTWKQCNLANQSFNRTDCCNGSGCNKDHTFDAALRLTRNYRDQVPPLPFEDIMKEINTGRPIVIRLMPRVGEIGHAVVITGYNNDHPDKPKIKIQNPDYWFSSDTVCDFDTFPESLGLFAETLWSYCCLTEPSSSKSEMNGALVSS